MSKIVIVYHSGYGHTTKVAQAVAEGSGAATGVLDPMGSALPLDQAFYPALLRDLAAGFAACP